MATPFFPSSVKFFTAILAADTECVYAAREMLAHEWGEIELASEIYPFTYSNYYRAEIGDHPVRAFFGFAENFARENLPSRKLRSNELEKILAKKMAKNLPRPVNLDPGYLALEKIVLASCKNFSHRLYLGNGVFGEITLFYRHGVWEALPWSFPDYASGDYDDFFFALRKKLTIK